MPPHRKLIFALVFFAIPHFAVYLFDKNFSDFYIKKKNQKKKKLYCFSIPLNNCAYIIKKYYFSVMNRLYAFTVGLIMPDSIILFSDGNGMDWNLVMQSGMLAIISVFTAVSVTILTALIRKKFKL